MTIRTIVVGVDLFPASEAVLARALEIAAQHDARLEIVHVIALHGSGGGDLGQNDLRLGHVARHDTILGQAALAAHDRIDAALTRLGADPARHDVRIETGQPALRLIEMCRDAPPDLIVMRAHQRAAISETILGSTSDRVVAAAVAPVLVVKRAAERPYANAIIASSGTDAAEAALAYTATLLPRARLRAVQAAHIVPQFKEAMLRVGTDQSGLDAHHATLQRNAAAQLAALAETAPRPVATSVLTGDPATELTRLSQDPGTDLIAVGPGRGGLIRRAFVGSVTRHLLREAGCDVLVCHLPDTE